jgi:TATA-binding protein-associated factor
MPRRSVTHVHSILLQMIRQDFPIPANGGKSKKDMERGHIWEVRHAGLLGIKYEVAVRSDLFETGCVKQEGCQVDDTGREILRGVVDAAILGYVICKIWLLKFR